MLTPFGNLADLDLSDHEIGRRVLAFDKHQLAEGLAVESLFDQYLAAFPGDRPDAPVLIDADTAIEANPGSGDKGNAAFVWDRGSRRGLGRYLTALGRKYQVWLTRFDNASRTFLAAGCKDGRRISDWAPLDRVAQAGAGRSVPADVSIDVSVRNARRTSQSFWGYLSASYGEDLGRRIVLPQIFLNFGIQPWFRYVWNIDRVYLQGDQLWHFEIKHKYPIDRTPLSFGINDGELRLIGKLAECGLRSLHTIIVKPRWDKQTGSMLLTNDLSARAAAAIIGKEITPAGVRQAMAQRAGTSGADTSFSGRTSLSFRSFPASGFAAFGTLGDPYIRVAQRIDDFMRGERSDAVTDHWLRSLRLG